ncbi:MAG TPA: BatA domain-containing protein, partial [Thermoanaerobaculia bacterium]|nr:BatA domain-containing protein [Thermoanaerobaculia bacterium]
MVLTSAWPLIALLAIPALVAIYLFQRRFRARDVSSLMLWEAIRQPSMGGRTREPLRLPLTFWLELLAIVLLALAATGPLIPQWSRKRPLVVVLDDSLSMRAGARDRGAELLSTLSPTRVVFAGTTPQLAGEQPLREWTCGAPAADLDAAIGFATEVGGPSALILVITDHAPDRKLEKGRLEWRAFGKATPNLAFAAAARSGDRLLVEIASYSSKPERTTLTLSTGQRTTIELAPRARYNAVFAAKGVTIEARIDDATEFDNKVVLLDDERPRVDVRVEIADEKLRDSIDRAVDATERRRPGGWPGGVPPPSAGETPASQPAKTPALLITDHA